MELNLTDPRSDAVTLLLITALRFFQVIQGPFFGIDPAVIQRIASRPLTLDGINDTCDTASSDDPSREIPNRRSLLNSPITAIHRAPLFEGSTQIVKAHHRS